MVDDDQAAPKALSDQGSADGPTTAPLRPPAPNGPTTAPLRPPAPNGPTTAPVAAASPGPRVSSARAFPVPGWERYQGVRLLGEGGMGQVFLAYDLRLRRHVALKFLHPGRGGLTRRFVAEARAQARIDDERVGKVYEVGEVEGRPYIAMQYVDGKPLHELVGVLGVEQKALVVRDAAEGAHAAHRAGLIHRDIKPSNIMVERLESGALKTYVMDFGIARDHAGDGAGTATGAVLGTPLYMAPEQARGEPSRLDRRADVYALGATLYHLLTGRPPIVGGSPIEVLGRLADVEPTRPRAIDPDLPADLEAIALKCLEKDRSARYDSARALADDLDRFLRGEPVLARPAGPARRAWRRARRHRALLGVAAASALAVALASGQAYVARRGAAEREAFARRFAGRVEAVKASARYTALSPRHDVRADRRGLRDQLRALDEEVRRAGPSAVGPGRAALGQGQLSLGDDDRARAELEAAWQAGYREPDVAYGLALVLGRRYWRDRLEAEREPSAERREARRREAERRWRDPALAYLKQSEGANVPSGAYVAALLASYEGRLDDALARLGAAGEVPPWFYEAAALEGDLLQTRALRAWHLGDRARSLADFDAGRAAYARAAAIAESVAAVYTARAELEHSALFVEIYGAGDVQPRVALGLEAVGRALEVDPDDPEARLLEGVFYRRLADHHARYGEAAAAAAAADQALDATRAAVDLAPGWPAAWLERGAALLHAADALRARDRDPRERLSQAVAALERGAPASGDPWFSTRLGLVHDAWADYEDQSGLDAREHRARAVDAYRAAIELDEREPSAWINLGIALLQHASLPGVDDPDGELARARAALARGRSLAPGNVVPIFYEGKALELEAQWRRDRGEDPRPSLQDAAASYRAGLALNPALPHLENGLGSALFEMARFERAEGRAPQQALEQAEQAFGRALALAPEQGFADNNLGDVWVERAAYQKDRRQDPAPGVREADAAYRRAIARLPGQALPWSSLARAWSLAAAFAIERRGDPLPALDRADRALREAFARNPNLIEAWALAGETQGLRARWQAERGRGSAVDFDRAAETFEKALALAPGQLEPRLAYAHFCLAWGAFLARSSADAAPPLRRGLALCDAALAARPTWPEATRLRAQLRAALAGETR